MDHCIVWDNKGTGGSISWSNREGGGSANNCINIDPLFIDEAGRNLHLDPTSPCRNAGNPAVTGHSLTDIDGEARAYATVDMGADEVVPVSGCPGEDPPIFPTPAFASLGFTVACPTFTQACDTPTVVMFGTCAATPTLIPPSIGCGTCGLLVSPVWGSLPGPMSFPALPGILSGFTFCVQCGCVANGFTCVNLSAGAQIVVVP